MFIRVHIISQCGSLKKLHHLLFNMFISLYYVIIFFITQIGDSTNDGQEDEMINLKSYRKTPLKVVAPKNKVHYALPSSDRSVKDQKLDYNYLCPITTKNSLIFNQHADDADTHASPSQWKIQKPFCLTTINFEQEKICERDFTFSINQQTEEQEKFTDSAVDIFIFGYDVCTDVDIDKKTVDFYQLGIYKVYADYNTKQPLHTEHQILTETPIHPPDFKTYMKELQLTQYAGTLQRLPLAYMNLEPKPPKSGNTLLSLFFQISPKHRKQRKKEKEAYKYTDYLIPQMLVPYSHLEPASARGANLNYLNTRPQYKRLRHTWDSISENIRYYLCSHQLYRRTKIYTSASNILKQNNKEVKINIANEGKKFQISVPYVWWYLIRADDGKAILILLYNIPLDFPYNEIIFFCQSICSDSGWRNMQSDHANRNIYAHCCAASKELLKNLGFIKSDVIQIEGILDLNDLRKELQAEKQENEKIKSTVLDAETSTVNAKTSVSDKGKSIEFISNNPALLSREETTETKNIFSSTSLSPCRPNALPSTESIVQGCVENITGNDCIHVVPTEIASETRSTKVRPNLVASETTCADEGIFYTFQYNKFVEMSTLYSVCYDKKEKETIYTVHKISANELTLIDLDKKNYIKLLESYGTDQDVERDLEDMRITYAKYLEGYKLNNENVVPQMLVPLIDLDQSYTKGANLHFFNIRPQYERLAVRWNVINAKILQHLLENKWNKDVTIYTGTALNLPKSSLKINELQLNEKFSIRMPMIWGKIIVMNSKSITILMYNIPFQHYLAPEQRLCKISICTETNWMDIEPIQTGMVFDLTNTHIQCCETTPYILKYFRLFHIGAEFNGRFEKLKLSEKSVPEQLVYPKTSSVDEDEITPAE